MGLYDLVDGLINTGWVCPKCGRVMAPFVVECTHCNKNKLGSKPSDINYCNSNINNTNTKTNITNEKSNMTISDATAALKDYKEVVSNPKAKVVVKDGNKVISEKEVEYSDTWAGEFFDEFLKALGK